MNVISLKSYAKQRDVNIISDEIAKNYHDTLIERIGSQKCRASFKKLYDFYAPKIKSFMLSKGANSTEAEDIAQETMIKIWRKAESFDGTKAKASTWIFTIARNLRIDYLRKLQRANNYKAKQFDDDFYEEDIVFNIDIENTSNALKENLKQLPNDQLQVIKLSFYENLSHSEIANSLSLPLGTVKSRLRLALNKLKSQNLESDF